MPDQMDTDAISAAYEDVRADSSENTWAVFGFEDQQIVHLHSGIEYEQFLEHLPDDGRSFVYVRVTTGDELSKRHKFAFITWIGCNCPSLQKAKMSTHKPMIQGVVKNFAVEIHAEDLTEVSFESVKDTLIKAGGANYGTGL